MANREEVPHSDDVSFSELGLDSRLLKSLAKMGWKKATAVQAAAIPLAIHKRKDILTRARTGSGKTGAYLIPILHLILTDKKRTADQKIRAVILSPSRELAQQIYTVACQLNHFTANIVTIMEFSSRPVETVKPFFASKPDIIIGTPGRLAQMLKQGVVTGLKESVEFLVLDEADLMFSFGYQQDIESIVQMMLPVTGCQSFLLSATLNTEVAALKKLCLKNAAILKLEESDVPDLTSSKLTQYHVQCTREEKYTLMYALLKLKLIQGRTLIFANSVDNCYRLRLFLEQIGVRSVILNPELPVTSRCHVVNLFNQGKYDILIASDEKTIADATTRTSAKEKAKRWKKDSDHREKDKEFTVSRGIDFQFVSNVVNFDFPPDLKSYLHRVGRTARNDQPGTALSFVTIADKTKFAKIKSALNNNKDQEAIRAYEFRMEELDSITYRCRDAVRAVTKASVKDARIKEIKRELLNSDKLQAFFKQHPKDYQMLKSDTELRTVKHQLEHLKDMPDYIIPPSLKGQADGEDTLQPVLPNKKRKRVKRSGFQNPLKTFSLEPVKNKKKKRAE